MKPHHLRAWVLSLAKIKLRILGPSRKARAALRAMPTPVSRGIPTTEEVLWDRDSWEASQPPLDPADRLDLGEGVVVQSFGTNPEAGILVWAHGGGFTAGSARTHQGLARSLVEATGLQVYLVQYSLSPEAPPGLAAREVAAACRIAQRLTPRVFLGGDSAGAHLALLALASLEAEGAPVPARLLLFSPWIHLGFPAGDKGLSRYRDPMVTAAGLRVAAHHYLRGENAPTMTRPDQSLRTLPPVLVLVGGREILRDDIRTWKRAWGRGGRRIRVIVYPGLWHVWPAWSTLPESHWAFCDAAWFLSHDQHTDD